LKAGADRLVILTDPRSAAAEAYRALRINLQFSSLDGPLRTLLITSAMAEEGKTATLCNLAVSFAQAGANVVIADCDLRRPSIHRIFDLANDKGLATMLLDDEVSEVPLQQTAVPGLKVLTTGPVPANPADLLSTRRIRPIIDSLSGSADLVLFDAAPVGLVAETAVLASQMDGVLLVVSAGKTRREAAVRAKSFLEKANARILGVVLNNARSNSKLYSY
jgi:capsular exopolysaccharide synthesis family protein